MKDPAERSCMRFMADVGEKLDAHSYPATTEELIEAYGDVEFDIDNGTETFGEAMNRLSEDTFVDSEDARTAAASVVGEDAVGRKGYSDRDPPTIGEESEADLLSF
jgi:hypothetical protein